MSSFAQNYCSLRQPALHLHLCNRDMTRVSHLTQGRSTARVVEITLQPQPPFIHNIVTRVKNAGRLMQCNGGHLVIKSLLQQGPICISTKAHNPILEAPIRPLQEHLLVMLSRYHIPKAACSSSAWKP